jgi:hypothetical protein
MYMRDRDGRSTALQIKVVPPIERKPPKIDGTASVSLVTEQTEVCCHFDDGVNLIWLECSALTSITSAVLSPGLSSSSPAALLEQYLFRYTERTSNTSALLAWGKLFELVVPVARERYCYELEAIDISTGAVHVYDDPDQLCAMASDFIPSSFAPMTLPDAALRSQSCPIPPNGYEEPWCDVNAKRCASSPRPDDCYFYGHACLGEPEPRWRLVSDADAPIVDPPPIIYEPRQDSCSVSDPGASTNPSTLGALLFALTLLLCSRPRTYRGAPDRNRFAHATLSSLLYSSRRPRLTPIRRPHAAARRHRRGDGRRTRPG